MRVEWWGRLGYREGLALQEAALEERRRPGGADRLLLLEHPEVITRGRSSHDDHVIASASQLEQEGIPVVEARRGGDVSYHAPGQLVGYFIHDLKSQGDVDLHAHLRAIEAALIDALAQLGVPCERVPGRTGVFVSASAAATAGPMPPQRRKIASIGIGVRHWITYHGFALNVSVDLAGFDRIVPCGLHDVVMTSLAAERNLDARDGILDAQVREAVAAAFLVHFD